MSRIELMPAPNGRTRWKAKAKGRPRVGTEDTEDDALVAATEALKILESAPSRSGAHRAERFGLKFPARHRPEWEWAAKEAGVPVATWVQRLANAEYEALRKVRDGE
jgi:hypothetical protein